ncbi:LOW QUALITY PROTEIN: transient-receptor-potential-like protein [Penaeus monodon]|uniref:LOW QUALITY PROTEIN: transient-receptor-potential-like protein n=1 Tax=Penaeus monodon TaxID=6687 RepID=UPI0018A6EB9C|nr:LOW QUALITY PROTEIN: transient-receptor-potential-like protein [Penaeus monodon]
MDPKERVFLEAAERGDKHTMMRCLSPPSPVNVNCTDILGRSAIQIAVDNENVEIVELLLLQETVKIGDALLYAITEGVYKIVEMLINHPSITPEMLANDWVRVRAGGEESSDFDPNISPIILAAHCNQFEILQLFLSRGAYIDKPHPLSCSCRQCTEGFHSDSLRYSMRRIHTYRALASPAWISLTSEDPILAAFRLSWELERLARVENEFKDTYLELSEQCKKYTCDLLHQCRSTEEVIAVLNRRSEEDSDVSDDEDDPERLNLSRLKLALKYDQKQFVAHPNCQQLLTSVWHEGLPIWRRRNAVVKILLCLSIIICMPVIAVIYLIFPRTQLGRVIRSPFMKFIYHSASFGIFLLLLVLASTRTEGSERHRRNIRGPAPTFVEWLIFFWVTGMVWAECKQLWEEGLTAYIRQWWNWLDFIMLSLYLCTFSLRAVAFVQITTNKYGPRLVFCNDHTFPKFKLLLLLLLLIIITIIIKVLYYDHTFPKLEVRSHFLPQTKTPTNLNDPFLPPFPFLPHPPREVPRSQWPTNDPTLIAEGVFAVANVFSFARIIYLFQTNPHLGPLQISLGCMIIDIAKFLFIFFLVLTSFACGLNQLYWYYDPPSSSCDISTGDGSCSGSDAFNVRFLLLFLRCGKGEGALLIKGPCDSGEYMGSFKTAPSSSLISLLSPRPPFRIDKSYTSLLWSLFGVIPLKELSARQDQLFTDIMGHSLLGAYLITAITVMVNMLIAMMSRSFQIVEMLESPRPKVLTTIRFCFKADELDVTFATLFWSLFGISSPKSTDLEEEHEFIETVGQGLFMAYHVMSIIVLINMLIAMMSNSFQQIEGGPPVKVSQANKYAEVMRRLVSRYIHQTKKQHRQDGVNEDDLLEIKQDISSLRYELREDRKRETARAYGQMDSIKKDILRLLKQSGRGSSSGRGSGGNSGRSEAEGGAVGGTSTNPIVVTTPPSATCLACAQQTANTSATPAIGLGAQGILQQHSVDLGMLGREPTAAAVDITVTPASSLPCNLTYSQGNLTGCLLAPQEMDYLRKEIVSSLRSELREMLRDALTRALTPTTTVAQQYYSPTPTPNPTPQFVTTPTSQMVAPPFPSAPSPQQQQQRRPSTPQPQAIPPSSSSTFPPAIPSTSQNPVMSPQSPTSQLPLYTHIRVSGSLSDPMGQRQDPKALSSSSASPSPRSSPGPPPPCQRSNSSCGLTQRSQGGAQTVSSSAKTSANNQVLLRPPNDSDRVHTHMYTQL